MRSNLVKQRSFVALCAMIALSAVEANAQRTMPTPHKPTDAEKTSDLLYQRNRSLMHPGDPLLLMGREQGDNDIRSRTPALAQGDRSITRVDPAENYARTLAMYEDRATFRAPLAAVTPSPDDDSAPRPAPTRAVPKPAAEQPAKPLSDWPWLLALGLPMGVVAWFFSRSKPAPRAPRRQEAPTL